MAMTADNGASERAAPGVILRRAERERRRRKDRSPAKAVSAKSVTANADAHRSRGGAERTESAENCPEHVPRTASTLVFSALRFHHVLFLTRLRFLRVLRASA